MIRMGDFRMKQQGVETTIFSDHCGDRSVRAGRDHPEPRRSGLDEVAVARPDAQVRWNRSEQRRTRLDVDGRQPELAVWGRRDLAAESMRHQLHAVANTEHREAGMIDAGFAMRRSGFGNTL